MSQKTFAAQSKWHQGQAGKIRLLTVALVALTVFPIAACARTVTATVPVEANPIAVGVNPVTNKVYISNDASGSVTVIDGATNSTTTVGAGIQPSAVAVNPVTNKIYVANASTNYVTADLLERNV